MVIIRVIKYIHGKMIENHENFYKGEFTYTSSAGKTARKMTKILQSF